MQPKCSYNAATMQLERNHDAATTLDCFSDFSGCS